MMGSEAGSEARRAGRSLHVAAAPRATPRLLRAKRRLLEAIVVRLRRPPHPRGELPACFPLALHVAQEEELPFRGLAYEMEVSGYANFDY